MPKLILLSALLAAANASSASALPDVTFTERPSDFRLYPRNVLNGGAAVPITGSVSDRAVAKVRLVVERDGQQHIELVQPLPWTPFVQSASFSFQPHLGAGFFNYAARVELLGGDDELLEVALDVRAIVVGDAYLVTGQSNARARVAPPSTARSMSRWIRTFGDMSPEPSAVADQHWYPAFAVTPTERAEIGAFAYQLAEEIIIASEVPVAILNGAVDNTRISDHQRSIFGADSTSIYGRLLMRAEAAGIRDAVRAIIWYQGESETPTSSGAQYAAYFQSLHAAWAFDYPAVERIFVLQIRGGCFPWENTGVYEAQRNLARQFLNVRTIATAGIERSDPCHYAYGEYGDVASAVATALARDLFGVGPDFDPPDALDATFDPIERTITVRFRNPGTGLQADSDLRRRFAALVPANEPISVSGAQVVGDDLVLTVTGTAVPTGVIFVSDVFSGTWLRSANGAHALEFALDL